MRRTEDAGMRNPLESASPRMIAVPLARVMRGQPRLLLAYGTCRSGPSAAVTAPIPKLIVRVRFSSPAPEASSRSAPFLPDVARSLC
jgi:hypothetical protein